MLKKVSHAYIILISLLYHLIKSQSQRDTENLNVRDLFFHYGKQAEINKISSIINYQCKYAYTYAYHFYRILLY
jgi:hypothetical protein